MKNSPQVKAYWVLIGNQYCIRMGQRLSIRKKNDNSILRDFLDENVRMGCPEAPLWAVWDFAVAKG